VPFPFDLPVVSRGFAAMTPSARACGDRVALAASASLATLIGREVSVRARPMPGVPAPRPVAARVTLDLTALPATALLEVDPALVVSVVDALAGGPGAATAATALTPIEQSALELLALAALDGACSVREVDVALAPRLSRGAPEPASALALELDVSIGAVSGRGRLLVPATAVRALADGAAGRAPTSTRIPVSIRSGSAELSEAELGSLATGDVVLLDARDRAGDALVLPGGARIRGRLGEATFEVEELMTQRNVQIPVMLEVELARVEVSLADIAQLEPGSALPLALDRRGVVTLRVGERTIGRGELVEVDGAVGVRVLSLVGTP
jgi:type III secretion protein Q